jgi:quercetin dioxygenase-like cupin family protein
MDDRELNRLLDEWKAPGAPPHLRPRHSHRSWLDWLVTGTIRVPVPVALATVAALTIATLWAASARTQSISESIAPQQASTPESDGPRRSGEIARYALTGPLEGYDAVLVELNFGPGASAPPHRHPGFVLGYVVNGQMRSAINHAAGEIVPAGGTFFEPSGAFHTTFGSAKSDAPVRILAFMVVPTGSPLTAR